MTEEPYTIEVCSMDDPVRRAELVGLVAEWAVASDVEVPHDHQERLHALLQSHPTVLAMMPLDGSGTAFGFALCQYSITSFHGRRSLNVHDIYVREPWRGRGVGHAMLHALERIAREGDCAKLTLEVDRENTGARRLYEELGFGDGVLGSDGGGTWFWRKLLD